MENWGGVIYSERALLFDEATGSADDRKVVHEFVVHELAHQWFGNLITMGWWDDLWLNEGFASWMEKKLTDEFNPSMKEWERTHAEKEKAMLKDALRTAHPVQQAIEDESEALAAFDDITYLKGLSLVRMLEPISARRHSATAFGDISPSMPIRTQPALTYGRRSRPHRTSRLRR